VPNELTATPTELHWLTIADAARLIESRRLSPLELIDALLANQPIQSARPFAATSRPPARGRLTRWPRFWRRITSMLSSLFARPRSFRCSVISVLSASLYTGLAMIALNFEYRSKTFRPADHRDGLGAGSSVHSDWFIARARSKRFSTLNDAIRMLAPWPCARDHNSNVGVAGSAEERGRRFVCRFSFTPTFRLAGNQPEATLKDGRVTRDRWFESCSLQG
jgi:hypothetical protein